MEKYSYDVFRRLFEIISMLCKAVNAHGIHAHGIHAHEPPLAIETITSLITFHDN
jgi:hypothetical protein